ncbi:MAG: DUF3592 domain-containing protein [Phycisphaeraceae bacterium]|nr:DUF3592 domain-containing protein [Phycisphaeraceae bacterium]
MTHSTRLSHAERTKLRRQILVGWIAIAFWGAFVVGFDSYFALTAFRQVRAGQTWQRTIGTITTSDIVTGVGSKGKTTYHPRVSFTYSVGSASFTGDVVEVGGMAGSGRKHADRIIQAFPLGSKRPIYFDPNDPGNSALLVGVQPGTLMMLMVALPFNAVLLGAAAFLFRARRLAEEPMSAWLVRDDGARAVLRLVHWAPMTAACFSLGAVSFVGVFAVMFAYDGEPPVAISGAVVVASLASFVLAYLWKKAVDASGRRDVVVDRTLKRVSPPRPRGIMSEASIRFDRLAVSIGPDSDRRINKQPAWKLVLEEAGADAPFTLHWLSRQDARRIANWIATECGVKVRDVGRESGTDDDSGDDADEDLPVGRVERRPISTRGF